MTDAERRAVQRAIRIAALHCGDDPVVGTLIEYQDAADAAMAESDRATETLRRWTRRFNPSGDCLQLGSERVSIRREIAKGLAASRVEIIQAFLDPPAGSA